MHMLPFLCNDTVPRILTSYTTTTWGFSVPLECL
jgi:hypothetical protein